MTGSAESVNMEVLDKLSDARVCGRSGSEPQAEAIGWGGEDLFVEEEGRGHEVPNELRGGKQGNEVRGMRGGEECTDGCFSTRRGWIRGTGSGEGGEDEKCDGGGESWESEGTWIALS